MANGDGLLGLLVFLVLAWGLLALLGRASRRARSRVRHRSPRAWENGLGAKARRRSWIELQAERTVRTRGGLIVRSQGERRVAELLDRLGIAYVYEPPMHGWRPDFYVPQWDLIIEYWGTDLPGTPKRQAKVATFLRHGHNLLDLEREDWPRLESVLLRKLRRFDPDVYRRARENRVTS